MDKLSEAESARVRSAIEEYAAALDMAAISLRVQRNFARYPAIRRAHGETRLNQAFDPAVASFGRDDFWLLAENRSAEPIATYCLRRFVVDDFYALVRSQLLWFARRPRVDRRFAVLCDIPPFGGEVCHGGGLWVREDYRGGSRLAVLMPRFARAVALRDRPFDHDTAMIRNDPRDRAAAADRKAVYMGRLVYGFARVGRLVDGWFPPERRHAVMHLCHADRAEALLSLIAPPRVSGAGLRRRELHQPPLVDQHHEAVDAPTVRGQRQHEAGVRVRAVVLDMADQLIARRAG